MGGNETPLFSGHCSVILWLILALVIGVYLMLFLDLYIVYLSFSHHSSPAMNTVLLSNLFSLPRIVYAMAEDGLFFSVFSRVNPITKVPVIAILVFGSLMSFLALIFDLESLVQFLSIGTLLAYTFVAASVIVLRFQPEKHVKKDAPAPSPGQQSNSVSDLKEV